METKTISGITTKEISRELLYEGYTKKIEYPPGPTASHLASGPTVPPPPPFHLPTDILSQPPLPFAF